jgi:hypothetical protein
MVGVAKLLRGVLFASFLLAVWTISRPAHASPLAPFCDDRGATALAAAPALEATDEAIQRAKTSACEEDAPLLGLAVGPAHHPLAAPAEDIGAAQAVAPSLLATLAETSIDFASRAQPRQHGVRGRIERPPRG